MISIFNAILIVSSLTLGYMPSNGITLIDPNYYNTLYESKPIFTDLNIRLDCNNFYAGGGVRTLSLPVDLFAYNPIQNKYTLSIGVNIPLDKVDINLDYTHWCEHVSSAMMVHLPKHMDKSNDAFSITIKSKGW